MVVQANFGSKSNTVAVYEIDAGDSVSFKVILKESASGSRDFELILSHNAAADYSQALNHPFYTDFVLPWVYREKEVAPTTSATNGNADATNVVAMSEFKRKK